MFPILNPPPSSLPVPSLWVVSSAPAPSIQYHASNLDWQFVSYMILYMFQCHSPKSSHPLPLPQSPKDCSIHLCLFNCLTYRVTVTTKNALLKPFGELGLHRAFCVLGGPCNKCYSAPNSEVSVCLASLCWTHQLALNKR